MCSSQKTSEEIFHLEQNLFLNLPSKRLSLHNHIQLRYQKCACKKTCSLGSLRKANNQIIDYLQKTLLVSETLSKKLTCSYVQKTPEHLPKKTKIKEGRKEQQIFYLGVQATAETCIPDTAFVKQVKWCLTTRAGEKI